MPVSSSLLLLSRNWYRFYQLSHFYFLILGGNSWVDKEINLKCSKNIVPFPLASATDGINDADKNLWNVRGFLLSFTLNCLNKLSVCRNLDESRNSPLFLPLSWSGAEALPHITCVSENAKTSSRAKSQATASAVCEADCFHCCHMLCILPALKFMENNSQSSLSYKWMQLLHTNNWSIKTLC